MKKNKRYLIIFLLLSLLCLSIIYFVYKWQDLSELTLKKSGIKYEKIKRADYIDFTIGSWLKTLHVDMPSYNKTPIVKIVFAAENDITNKPIGEEIKNKYPDNNYTSIEKIHDQLKSISRINRPVFLMFNRYNIDKNVVELLNSIPEIQSLAFRRCSFEQCSLKNINTSKHFFTLTLSECTSSQSWKDILFGIKNFHKLNIWQSSTREDDWQNFFSAQMDINEIEIISMNIPENIFDKIVFSPNLKIVSIMRSSISNNDIQTLVKSLDKKTTLQLLNCRTGTGADK